MKLFPPSYATWLGPDDFFRAFDTHWHRLKQRFLKIERLQEYLEPDDPSYQAFLKGDAEEARQLLAKRIEAQRPLFERAAHSGVEIVRVRIAEFPLSPYLQYELDAYRFSMQLGEQVRVAVTSDDEVARLLSTTKVSDCLFFDQDALLIHNYDETGLLTGGWEITDRTAICDQYLPIANTLVDYSIPFDDFERSLPR